MAQDFSFEPQPPLDETASMLQLVTNIDGDVLVAARDIQAAIQGIVEYEHWDPNRFSEKPLEGYFFIDRQQDAKALIDEGDLDAQLDRLSQLLGVIAAAEQLVGVRPEPQFEDGLEQMIFEALQAKSLQRADTDFDDDEARRYQALRDAAARGRRQDREMLAAELFPQVKEALDVLPGLVEQLRPSADRAREITRVDEEPDQG